MDDPTMTPRPLGDLSLNPSRAKATSFRRTLCVAQAALKNHVGDLETERTADPLVLTRCKPSCATGSGPPACGYGSLCSLPLLSLGARALALTAEPAPGSLPAPRSQSAPVGVPPWCHRRLSLRAPGPLYLQCPVSPAGLSPFGPARLCATYSVLVLPVTARETHIHAVG